jgi:hypothetical protein
VFFVRDAELRGLICCARLFVGWHELDLFGPCPYEGEGTRTLREGYGILISAEAKGVHS